MGHSMMSNFKRFYSVLRYPGKICHKVAVIPPIIEAPIYEKAAKTESFISSLFRKEQHLCKKSDEINRIQKACILGRKVLNEVGKNIKVGVSTIELDEIAREFIVAHSAYPSPLGYKGFPKSICTSVNNVVVHGIPDQRKLEEGDIVNVDISVYLNGVHGDLSEMFCVGEVDSKGLHLIKTTKKCLMEAIKVCRHDESFSRIGEVINSIAASHGYTVCPYFVGHGIGKYFHEQPQILHHFNNATGRMLENMVFTIEPVLCEGYSEINYWDDGWTVVTKDEKRAAQFEHTILITKYGAEVLTK